MKKNSFQLKAILIIIGIAALVLLMRDLNNRMYELRRLQFEADQVGVQYTQVLSTRDALQQQVTEAAQQVDPRDFGGKNNEVQPGDVLVIPVPVGGAVPTPTPATITNTLPTAKWQLWWAMFFDQQP